MKYKILWYSDYYDGPLSGLILYEGEELWFSMFSFGGWLCSDCDNDKLEWDLAWLPRMYKVIKLTRYELNKRKLKHLLFVLMVKKSKSKLLFSLFYKLFRAYKKHDNSNSRLIGAFSDSEYVYNFTLR